MTDIKMDKRKKTKRHNAGVIYKFRGDNLYHQKSYTEALDLYKEGLGFIFLCFIFEILV
jgi:hypothetical protein